MIGLPKRQALFLAYLAQSSSLDRRDYQALAGISHTTAEHDLRELLQAGLIVRLGRGRASRYALNPPESVR